MTAHPVIQEAVAELCCIRDASIGAVAKMRREQHTGDTKAAIAHANKHRADALETKENQASSRGEKLNTWGEIILVENVLELQDHLSELGVGAKKEMLSMQVNKRINFLHREYPLEAIPESYRIKKRPAGGKYWTLKMSPSNGENKLEHLTKLVELMVAYEQEHPFDSDNDGAPPVRTARNLHTISTSHVPAHLVATYARLEKQQQEKAKAIDDPLLLKFHADHHGKLLYEYDDPKKRTFRVKDIKWLPKKKHWVAECVVVELSAEGKWETPRSMYVGTAANDSLRSNPVLKKNALEDFFLADATDPSNIQCGAWVGKYTEAHAKR